VAAVEALLAGQVGNLVGWTDGRISLTPLAEVVGVPKVLDPELIKMARVLGT
jgi:hypothetical protein